MLHSVADSDVTVCVRSPVILQTVHIVKVYHVIFCVFNVT